ncbi:aminotransferase class I/II-fold pyridoxal phosphate-dependent enzyme [Staphylococcus hyicus]|uniref:aminotransferase class I/II-fold pyridoxal phosphate-dependent enzyme n=1 Tax=Staphylococcus hyicus TaxID=1284 RepID=UPI00208E994D|nr:pyridoxal phosphate-dependent aminotransferase family protein [Staphylococcus hyicus]MCO4330616.1 pyridoxal phosphate-dependent aminotransferase family protein [Staphylococcus hyicus]MCO4333014.1 pyridoxal phosphate-dependent aminotransferase family protein [Staphylococcus hyicus]
MNFDSFLKSLQSQGQYRQLREVETAQKQRISRDGKTWINFTSNDYLGLGQSHINVAQLQARIDQYGTHLASSRLVSGHSRYYTELETRISKVFQFEAACIMTNGYDANLAVFQIFKHERVIAFSDALNHASIIDGIRLSNVQKVIFPHLDYHFLEHEMKKYPQHYKVVVTDSVFSTNGHIANLERLRQLKEIIGKTMLIIDDSHGFGLGYDIQYKGMDIVTTSLSKGLGAHGGLILCSSIVKDMIVNTARPLIYSNCMPTMHLHLIESQFEALLHADDARRNLHENITCFNTYIKSHERTASAIKSFKIDDVHKANVIYHELIEAGFWVSLFRYPTVKNPTLRMSLTACHESADIHRLMTFLHDKGGVYV